MPRGLRINWRTFSGGGDDVHRVDVKTAEEYMMSLL